MSSACGDRQRQPSPACPATTRRSRLSASDRRAGRAGRTRERANSRSSTSRPTSAGCCARTTARCPGGFSTAAGACPARVRAITSALPAPAGARVDADRRRDGLLGPLYAALWRPLLLAALNTEPPEAAAGLAAGVLRETLLRGGGASRPLIARDGLSAALDRPGAALPRKPQREGASSSTICAAIEFGRTSVAALDFGDEPVRLDYEDGVVLAVPAGDGVTLVPGLEAPRRVPRHRQRAFRWCRRPDMPPMIGVVNGTVEWIFSLPATGCRSPSAPPTGCSSTPREALAETIWRRSRRGDGHCGAPLAAVADRAGAAGDVRRTAGRERQAAGHRKRAWDNLVLAGDWTATGLPATIEGAIRSGEPRGATASRATVHEGHDRTTVAQRCARVDMAGPSSTSCIQRRHAGTARPPAAGRTLGVRARGRRHHPGRIRAAAHFLGETPDNALEGKIAAYLRRIQGAHGGWPLIPRRRVRHERQRESLFRAQDDRRFAGRPITCGARARRSSPAAARPAATCSRAPARALSASCRGAACPVMPVEIMLLPRWFPFHLDKISYWARTVIVPLLVLQAFKPKARNPRGIAHRRNVRAAAADGRPGRQGAAPEVGRGSPLFGAIDAVLRVARAAVAPRSRRRAIEAAVAFVSERLNGEDGPRRDLSGHGQRGDDVRRARLCRGSPRAGAWRGRRSTGCWLSRSEEAYCQPCVSPVWDTALACHALLEAGGRAAVAAGAAGPRLARSRCRCSTSPATGRRGARTCGPAAGRSNTPTRTIRTSTTPPSW